MSRHGAYLGAAEVRDLIGKWQSIVGGASYSDRFQDILGADISYNPYPGGYRQPQLPPPRHHHHHHRGYAPPPPAPYYPPQAYYQPPPYQPAWQRPMAPPVVRVHNAGIAHRAFVQGDPVALGALELMGAEDAAQAANDMKAAPEVAAQAAAASEETVPSGGGGRNWCGPDPVRNLMVDRPGPTRADRVLLPMSSGVSILPNTSAQITSRPQNVAFRPERVIIGGTAGDWIVNDIKVGNRSQFSQSGDVPGETFASTTIDSFVSFETVQTAMDFVMLVTYIGASESGAPFYCAVLGTAAI